jgi:predicted ATP-dependent endonuclease of OLD family
VYKASGFSSVVIPDKKDLVKKSQKDIFLFITSSNNEKVFFADKVVLVEGIVDRIIFEAVLQTTQKSDDDEVIEIVEVLGKDNFKRFTSFLETWKINHSTIADNDYLRNIGSREVKNLYVVSTQKIKKQINNKASKDTKSLLNSLLKITERQNPKKITLEEFKELKELTSYIAKRNITLKDGLSDDEKSKIDTEIVQMKSKGIFVLKKGTIEDYFDSGDKIDIDKAITISKKLMKKKLTIPSELKEIVTAIIENGNSNQIKPQISQGS